MEGASCVSHQHLPWTGELTPPPAVQAEMTEICAECPVVTSCAAHAITTRNVGGFYAGVWLPWPHQGGGCVTRAHGRARRTLQKLFPVDP